MATKKSSKKSGGGKKSAAKKGAGGGAKAAKRRSRKRTTLDGLPPVILGGGGSILIYSTQELEKPKLTDRIPAITGYPYVMVFPDRTKNPRFAVQKRRGVTVHKDGLDPGDIVVIESN